MSLPIVIVAAVAANGVIGVGGGLPWKVRSDLKKFRAVTMGKPVVMGRKTFESLGRVLDGRDVIVVTRQEGFALPAGVFVAGGLDQALQLAEQRAAASDAGEICIGGGGEIYRAAFPRADRLSISHISAEPAGDTTFPKISPAEWIELSREELPRSEGDTATAVHVVYGRRR